MTHPDAAFFPVDFTPVPLARVRHDGWTADRQGKFLQVLSLTGTVDAAARAVGMSRVSAYKLRQRPGAESFAAAWDRALKEGRDMLCDAAMERALYGVTTVRMRIGGVIEVEHGPDRKLLASFLRLPPTRPGAAAAPGEPA
jgi:hypothetical protein